MARPLLPIAALLALAAAMPGGARADQKTWKCERFDRVSLYGANDVYVQTGGSEWKVVAQGDAEDIAKIVVDITRGSLTVGPQRRHGGWEDSGDVRIRVYAPRIEALNAAGSGDVRLNRASGRAFASSVAGSGSLRIDQVNVTDLAVSIAGSGSLGARGRCTRLKASVAGSGEARLDKVECEQALVNVAGSGAVAARASAYANVSAIGSGAVRIHGGPKCNIRRLGSAQVYCEGGQSLLSGIMDIPAQPEPPEPPRPPRW